MRYVMAAVIAGLLFAGCAGVTTDQVTDCMVNVWSCRNVGGPKPVDKHLPPAPATPNDSPEVTR